MDGAREATGARAPTHVAIIMDGNGRWANARGLPRAAGHRQGAEAVRRTVEASIELGISYLTLFGFSAENWKRPATEVDDLMGLLRRYLQAELDRLHKEGIRLRVIGDRTRLPPDVVRQIAAAEVLTQAGHRLNLTIAISYGGRQDILAAARSLARDVAAGRLDPDAIGEDSFSAALSTAGIPDPDLLVRTSGEQRISNFLLWQSAYSELVFLNTLWPDFGKEDLAHAIREFQRRDRRYGAAVGSG
ncbi:MAG TPA: isoprenyl transferase [Kiloniellales bacterium]